MEHVSLSYPHGTCVPLVPTYYRKQKNRSFYMVKPTFNHQPPSRRSPSQQAGKAHSLTHNLQTRPTDHHGDSFMGSAGISQRVISHWWAFGRHRDPVSLKDGLAVMVIIDSIERYRANLQQQDNYRRKTHAERD